MSEAFEALSQLNEIRTGQNAAIELKLDVLIGTLVRTFPPVGEALKENLLELAPMKRPDEEDGLLAQQAYDASIVRMLQTLEALE